MSVRSRLLSALNSLKTPPSKESVWIGPFDQLVSSAYSLLEANELGFAKRSTDDYYKKVFCRIVPLVSKCAHGRPLATLKRRGTPGGKTPSARVLGNYLSGIYFNAGYQRLIWAAERLVTTFGAVNCKCGCSATIARTKKARWPPFDSKARPFAKNRLESCRFKSQLPSLGEMLSQFEEWDNRTCCRNKALSILSDQVNPKKHSVYDYEQVKKSIPLVMPCGNPWTPMDQVSLVVDAFELVCEAYCELLEWNREASLH